MQVEKQPQAIPNFVSAASPQGLRRLMLKTNARLGAWVRYFDIQQANMNGRLVWVAWYFEPVQTSAQLDEILGNDGGEA